MEGVELFLPAEEGLPMEGEELSLSEGEELLMEGEGLSPLGEEGGVGGEDAFSLGELSRPRLDQSCT